MHGFSSELSGPPSNGWGAHAFDVLAGGVWIAQTKTLLDTVRISISPLELLATAVVVLFVGNEGPTSNDAQLYLPCENTSACEAANTEAAYNPAMRLALNIFVEA